MRIQELIDELSKIRDKQQTAISVSKTYSNSKVLSTRLKPNTVHPEKDVVIEVFDIKESRITRGWMFDIVIDNSKDVVKIRQKKFRGWNLYLCSRTKDIEELEKSLCTNEKL